MSVTVSSVPKVVERATVSPPVVRLLPLTSLSWTVMVEVDVPSAVIEAGAAVINEVAAEAAPGVKLTVTVFTIATVFTVPVIEAVPAVAAEVSAAV